MKRVSPAVITALRQITQAVDASGLPKPLTELLKLRVSQLNGCEFCVQFHLNLARQNGVPAPKLDLLAGIVRKVLTEAIAVGGSTLRDFAGADGALGYFQHRFRARRLAPLVAQVGIGKFP